MDKRSPAALPRPRAGDEHDAIDLGRLFGYLVDYRWFILGCALLFMLLGGLYVRQATPIYRANALLQVEKQARGAVLLDKQPVTGDEEPDGLAEIELLTSRMVLERTVRELNLDNFVRETYLPVVGRFWARLVGEPRPHLRLAQFEVSPSWRGAHIHLTVQRAGHFSLVSEGQLLGQGAVGTPLVLADITLQVSELAAEEGQEFLLVKMPILAAIDQLQQQVRVSEKGKNTGILSLVLEGEQREQIRQVLGSITQNYVQQNISHKTEEMEKSLQFLQGQLPELKAGLNQAEEQLNSYRQQHDSVDLSMEAKSALDNLVLLDKQLNELMIREAELQHLYTQKHPAYVALNDKRQTLLNKKTVIEQSIKQLPKTQQEIVRLTREVKVGNEIFMQLLNKQQELNIMKAATGGNVRIIDEAVAEIYPVKPHKTLAVVGSAILGFILAVVLVLVRAVFNRSIERPEQLEELGLAVYATIPYSAEQAMIIARQAKENAELPLTDVLLAASCPADLAMEALRALRTSLHFAMLDARNKIVMISSAGPGQGKSFVAANFAATLALGGQKVLVIDADLRQGHLDQALGQIKADGLSTYLSGQATLTAVVRATGFASLDVITRGEVPPNPAELLLHERLPALLAWATEQYDFIIIDSPPILAVTDAAIIGQHVGTSLFVARFGKTDVQEVDVAVRRFVQSGVPIKGVLLNAIEKKASGYYGNYGYYQYSYGAHGDKPRQA
ncbi:MAG: polysaccharide biosynthesis tyrosine autokinase [Aeromonas sp.]